MPVCVYVWHLIRSMSFNNAHVGDSAGVSAPVSFDSMLAKLGEVHRGGLNQAQVLSKVAELAQASAVMGPGFLIPESEASAIWKDIFDPAHQLHSALLNNVNDHAYVEEIMRIATLYACRCVGKARAEQANHID